MCIRDRPQLVLLYKTLLNIEGLGRQLYPNLNLWDTAKPFLEDWMKKQLSPAAIFEDLKRDWPQWRAIIPQLPYLVNQHIENSKSREVVTESNKSPLLRIGLTTAAFGLLLTMTGHFFIDGKDHILNSIGPLIGVAGLFLAFIKSK